ncbi:bacteriohemerythrin [Psychrobium sp. 1_MG-2023]|uniref:bacteriohemerythrin n=1 Tax=Psychrobium sp. 1_MG-2023 TaxID=3062624 RepID=UPI0026822CB8|nr:bacteriohemerythrin [Psychrobium sp. 1_MG-2023]MDP2562967.1 bacteriohemerythrin [Psychrobium sp. 1_MG-2023]
MIKLEWNAGMSVGVDSIDNDHKKIIRLLAELSNAVGESGQQQYIEETFEQLEQYVQEHFEREERLLSDIGYAHYAEHCDSHQAFFKQLAQLKKRWQDECEEGILEVILDFLHHWLVNHILIEDLDYSQHVYQTKLSAKEQANESLLQRLSSQLANRIPLSNRVLISILFPFIGVAFLCMVLLGNNVQNYQHMQLLSGMGTVLANVNALTHSLQAERGLTTGLMSSNYKSFNIALTDRRNKTDELNAVFWQHLEHSVEPQVKQVIMEGLPQAQTELKSLQKNRLAFDSNQVSFEQIFNAYSTLIDMLLSKTDRLINLDVDHELMSSISTINSMLLYKEYLGQIRAEGVRIIETGQGRLDDSREISLLIGMQRNALRTFDNFATNQQKQVCAQFCLPLTIEKKIRKEMIALSVLPKEVQGDHWFVVMSQEMDQLKLFTDQLILSLDEKAKAKITSLHQGSEQIIIAVALIVVLSICFVVVLNHSIIFPIRQVTSALNKVSSGDRGVRLHQFNEQDEIGNIYRAYEKLRRKLLQVDVMRAMVEQQQELLEQSHSETKHFRSLAETDALTGAVNRHHFDTALQNAIISMQAVKAPLSIMMLDIDHFKQINDSYGHLVGDEVLIRFYQACKSAARGSDTVARIGGEEFVVIMPNTNAQHALQIAERLRKKIKALNPVVNGITVPVTVSIGVSEWHDNLFELMSDLVNDADQSLYLAKNSGRDKVVFRHEPMVNS